MPWEYTYKIRSGIQPFICYLLFGFLRSIGFSDPFTLATALRLFMALFSAPIIINFIKTIKKVIAPSHFLIFVLLSYFLWFLPYINVRFSSESFSGIIFLACVGQAITITPKSLKAFIILGLTLGFSVLARYQSAFLVAGLLAWLVFVKKAPVTYLIITISGIITILALGILIDRWLYGEFTCSMYNYFKANIIDDVASQFGTLPWYTILLYIILKPGIPIGVLIFISFAIVLLMDKKNILIWSAVPFLLIHTIIGHKELRFLFPLVNLVPFLLVSAIEKRKLKFPQFSKPLLYVIVLVSIAFNAIALSSVSIMSTRSGQIALAEYIYENYKGRNVNVLTSYESNPYDPFMNYSRNFYRSVKTHNTEISSIWQPDFKSLIKSKEVNLLVLAQHEITGPKAKKLLQSMHAREVCNTVNPILGKLTDFYDVDIYNNALTLYQLN